MYLYKIKSLVCAIFTKELVEMDIVLNLMKNCMENVVNLNVPLDVSVNTGKTWGEAK